MLGHSIVSQHFMEPEGSIPNSQELSTFIINIIYIFIHFILHQYFIFYAQFLKFDIRILSYICLDSPDHMALAFMQLSQWIH
jgi:hypothetical protein